MSVKPTWASKKPPKPSSSTKKPSTPRKSCAWTCPTARSATLNCVSETRRSCSPRPAVKWPSAARAMATPVSACIYMWTMSTRSIDQGPVLRRPLRHAERSVRSCVVPRLPQGESERSTNPPARRSAVQARLSLGTGLLAMALGQARCHCLIEGRLETGAAQHRGLSAPNVNLKHLLSYLG